MVEPWPAVVLLNPLDRATGQEETPFGAVAWRRQRVAGRDLLLLDAGSGDERAVAYAARSLGASRALALIAEDTASAPTVPQDFIEFTSGRPTTFFERVGTGYVQQDPPFCPEWRAALLAAGAQPGQTLLVGDELPGERSRRWWREEGVAHFATWSQPLGALCRELELCWGTLLLPPGWPWAELLARALPALPPQRACPCRQSMALPRRLGRLPADWHDWFSL